MQTNPAVEQSKIIRFF